MFKLIFYRLGFTWSCDTNSFIKIGKIIDEGQYVYFKISNWSNWFYYKKFKKLSKNELDKLLKLCK